MLHINFNADINYPTVQETERLLAEHVGQPNPGATIYICSGGGDSTAGIGLFHFIKSLPYPVHTHAMGFCASGGVTVLLAGQVRTCSPGTLFMLHGSKGSNGLISPQVSILKDAFSRELGWDETRINSYFSTIDEKYFPDATAAAQGIIHEVKELEFPANDIVHVIKG